MLSKKLLLATAAVAVIDFFLSFAWYDVLMKDYFPVTAGIDNPNPSFPLIVLGVLVFSYAFVRLYQLAFDDQKPIIPQAINFGVLIGLLTAVTMGLIYSATRIDWSMTHFAVDSLFQFVLCIILAIVTAKVLGSDGGRGTGGESPSGPTRIN